MNNQNKRNPFSGLHRPLFALLAAGCLSPQEAWSENLRIGPTVTYHKLVDKTIIGKVVDEKSSPLPGVSVVVKGTTTGSITGTDGTFSLSVPETATTLSFSFIGYASQEIAIANQSNIQVI